MLTEEQKAKRCEGIGASDSPIIMGYSTYKSPYQLYLEKTGAISSDDELTEAQYWGNELEPLILKRFERENNTKLSFPDTVYHPEYPFIFANLDGWIESEKAVVEAKSANGYQKKEWDPDLKDGIPMAYLIQIAKQCAITNASRGYCAVLFGGNEYNQYIYERDAALEALIIEADINFWNAVQNKIPPDPINTNDCRIKYKSAIEKKSVNSTFAIEHSYTSLSSIKANISQLQKQEEKLKTTIMDYMKDSEYLIDADENVLASWKVTKKGSRVFLIK